MFGDWGLGIGDWAIPNPQSPIPTTYNNLKIIEFTYLYKIII